MLAEALFPNENGLFAHETDTDFPKKAKGLEEPFELYGEMGTFATRATTSLYVLTDHI